MNHLEQLVSEWLQYNGYFVRVSVPVGRRSRGGYEGELDVVGLNIARQDLLHVECSLDSLSDEKRESRFALKFSRGRKYIDAVFEGLVLPRPAREIAVLQFASGRIRTYGGAKLVTVRELVHEIVGGLKGTSPSSGAVPSHLPLLRTVQLAAFASPFPAVGSGQHSLLLPKANEGNC
jgi:hypothetical protein